MLGFERKRDFRDFIDIGATVTQLSTELDDLQLSRLKKIKRYWNFYEGYHWEETVSYTHLTLPTTSRV